MQNIARELERLSGDFGFDRKRSIGEVAKEIGVETHVIRFWEEQFPQIKPETGKAGRRYYYNKQVEIIKNIKKFLHEDGYTIAGLQKLLKKRKNDSDNEDGLDVIIGESFENEALEEDNSENDLKKQEISLDFFIDPKINLTPEKYSSYDLEPSRKDEVVLLVNNINKNLEDLKKLLRS